MSRSKTFALSRQPSFSHEALHIKHKLTTGPFSFLNPTRAHFAHHQGQKRQTTELAESSSQGKPTTGDEEEPEQPASSIGFQWRSRDNRKGRHTLIIEPATSPSDAPYLTPPVTTSPRAVLQGILRIFTQFPYWDVSYLVATIFTIGSVVWVINGYFSWLPLVQPSTEFPSEMNMGGGITAFIGATIFEFGSILLMFEAVNENRSACFGWALEKVVEGDNGQIRVRPDVDGCNHHHTNKKNLVGKGDATTASEGASDGREETPRNDESDISDDKKAWQWFPSTYDLKTHYLREIGFLACLSQLFGASVFWISGFTALPGINNVLSQGLLDGIFWTPQIIGGSGFIVSGILFMLETQKRWYLPAPTVLGWQIGLWNLIGAIGFTLCGALGPAYASNEAQYQASLATFWGSWAFLIGSVIQWYESLDTHPVEKKGRDT